MLLERGAFLIPVSHYKLDNDYPDRYVEFMDNKQKILATALNLFAEKGYEATGVQEIVTTAGLTKPTLYHYFGSKKGLLEELLTKYNTILNRQIAEAIRPEDELHKSLTEVAAVFFHFAQRNSNFYRMQLAMFFGPVAGEPIKIISALANPPYELLRDLFISHLNSAGDGEELICMAYAVTFIGILHQHISLYLNDMTELSPQLIGFVVDSFLYGVKQ